MINMYFKKIISWIGDISLRFKLLIPLFLFVLLGTSVFVYIGLTTQQALIGKEEKKGIERFYRVFLTIIDHKKDQALSLSETIAENSEVRELLAGQDREGLIKLMSPLYHKLRADYGIRQFHFHIPPGRSFLRFHMVGKHGDILSYRKTICEVMKTGKSAGGLEWGVSGLGIRGVSPVFYNKKIVGSIEIGFPFDKRMLIDLKKNWGPDYSVYENKGLKGYTLLATTRDNLKTCLLPFYSERIKKDMPLILIEPPQCPEHSILFGFLHNYRGEPVALVEINVNRSLIIKRLFETRKLMVLVGLIWSFVSCVLFWMLASLFIRPIEKIVGEAGEIAEGKREVHLKKYSNDEIGVLTQSLNMMLNALKERRRQIQDYARTLEQKVRERTSDLVSSEEKYRLLVDNVPLIVYRVLDDGTTEFINPYFTEKLGYKADEVVGDKKFWAKNICGQKDFKGGTILAACWGECRELRVERIVKHKEKGQFYFIDQAMPRRNSQGDIKWIDGIMMDITELKLLQDRAIRTEEIRVLGEISARFAHEIRNPLSIAGGFARRLRNSLDEKDHNREIADIILKEVARLENILQVILSTIEPFTLCIAEVDITHLLELCLADVEDQIKAKRIVLEKSISTPVPKIQGDESFLCRAFETLFQYAISIMADAEKLFISMFQESDYVVIIIRHRVEAFSEDDLEQFFLPRFTAGAVCPIKELPLSKVIIHRHGGKIDVSFNNKIIEIRIELPIRSPGTLREQLV